MSWPEALVQISDDIAFVFLMAVVVCIVLWASRQ